ncbi:MAG TPA: SDR family oxidoreductase [Polyangiaceae bacterium]|nr:SDR family oxidoreductase [Polyangiaceae bacterium]
MKILFVGGTGIISRACAELAIARGMDVTLLNRGGRAEVVGARVIRGDIHDAATASALRDQRWDAVVDFIVFKPEEVAQRHTLFEGRTQQYILISSASAYQKPAGDYLITESTPLVNPFWDYSRDKIACEEALLRVHRESAFPITIVRPSYTYDRTLIPLAVNAWGKTFTVVDRMRRGLPVIVPGDGLTLWTMTHSTDFARGLVGLLGHRAAIGHAFHITSDEALTWNQLYESAADAAGVSSPKLVHLACDFIAAGVPEAAGSLLGDKANCAVFDNSKIKRFVPDYRATTRFHEGIRESIAWFDQEPSRKLIDEAANARWDALIAANEVGLQAARKMRSA